MASSGNTPEAIWRYCIVLHCSTHFVRLHFQTRHLRDDNFICLNSSFEIMRVANVCAVDIYVTSIFLF